MINGKISRASLPLPGPLVSFLSIGLSGMKRRKPLLIPRGERVRSDLIRYRNSGEL